MPSLRHLLAGFTKERGALSLRTHRKNAEQALSDTVPVSKGLHRFNGGVHMPTHKDTSVQTPLHIARLPKDIVLPMQQHIGVVAEPTVKIGDAVLKGQKIAKAPSYVSAPIHAPTSGKIIHIGEKPIPHSSGLEALCVTIEPDGKDQWCELSPTPNYLEQDKATLRNIIREAGIVGLGGAAFPSAVKINPQNKLDKLIINGAECEPYITCDQILMSERGDEVIKGIQLLLHILDVNECWIGIEDTMPTAFEGLTRAIHTANDDRIKVKVVPTIYPTGGEKQLIKVLTGKEVPSNGIPADIGLVCHNPGTAVAMYKAVAFGEPLISRIVTVTGSGIKQPQNIEALFGTPISHLVEEAGGYTKHAERLILGGPMMGFAMHTDALPIVKASNCILVANAQEINEPESVSACIRCGACADACPANLLPQQLYWFSKSRQFDEAQSDYNLFDCIECGCCSYVCPSNIPLVQYYRFAKTEIRNANVDKQKADKAKARHDFRLERIEREQKEKAEALRLKKEALAKKKAEDASVKNSDQANSQTNGQSGEQAGGNSIEKPVGSSGAQDLIAAAVARAKAKKSAINDKRVAAKKTEQSLNENTDNDSAKDEDTKDNKQDLIAAAIARAKAKQLDTDQETAQPDNKQSLIEAAKARALAKKQNESESSTAPTPSSDIKDDRQSAIEAAKARALAKQQSKQDPEPAPTPSSDLNDTRQSAIEAAKQRALNKAKEKAKKDSGK